MVVSSLEGELTGEVGGRLREGELWAVAALAEPKGELGHPSGGIGPEDGKTVAQLSGLFDVTLGVESFIELQRSA